MKILRYILLSTLLCTAARAEQAEAYSRIYRHKDGTRTESFKNGDKNLIQEFTYSKQNILTVKRVFVTDSKGRCRSGVIYDAKLNPMGSIYFGYDPQTSLPVDEKQYNREGKLIRRLYYPGTLKDPAYANRYVALNFDPNRPNAAPVISKEKVAPTKPVESDQDEFVPGIPIGPSAPAANAAPAPRNTANAAPVPAAPRKRFFGNGNTAAPSVQTPPPAPMPAPRTAPAPVPEPPPAAVEQPAAKPVAPKRRPQT
ncbi:MAG TPA: hypothetical protein VHM91_11780 [Verrucomicrobiales bacterium]|jgi:hypothetical protein|nr:hypothetical protein [Verrucomicrobiales bacterium]